jgi:short subunit dehydrogenase-like uncharacterized protein
VAQGTVLGPLGPNGSGKMTAVRIRATLLRPDDGRVVVGGYDAVRQAHQVRQLIGLTGQYPAVVSTVGVPTGELHAVLIASGAPSVIATSSEVPTTRAMRAILPLASTLMSIPPLRRFATRRLASIRLSRRPRPREHSWGHAVVRWPDGTTREGWLRTNDCMTFTVAVVVEVAARLARGDARPGAYTPAAAFGPDIAIDVGGEFILD